MVKKTTFNINIVLCVTLCLMAAASLAFIAHEHYHDCPGEGCHVCINMHGCLSFARGILLAAAILCALSSASEKAGAPRPANQQQICAVTPITLKVKLTS